MQFAVYASAADRYGPRLAHALLGLALVVPIVTLIPAVAWAWGHPLLSLDEMVRYHGLANAMGHAPLGLVSLAWIGPSRRYAPLRAPLSRLRARGRVSASVLGQGSRSFRGLSDDLRAYTRADFDTTALPPEIIAFYEDTAMFELDLQGYWRGPFVVAGWLWSTFIAPALGQLGLPRPGQLLQDSALDSQIVDVDEDLDGRANPRGWVRHWKHDGSVLYVAAYAEHERDHVRYMNIAFALPAGFNLTSILHLARAADGALTLTSRHHQNVVGDQGVYLVRNGKPFRLPLDETISVYAAEDAPPDLSPANATLVARHDMWFLGIPYLTMNYQIRRRGSQ